MARDSEHTDTAALLARLQAALAVGEAAATRLESLAGRHRLLDREARATVATLDRLIATGSAHG